MRLATLYAIIDNKTNDITGMVMTFKHDVQAIRTFSELGQRQDTDVGRNLPDMELHRIGHLTMHPTDGCYIEADNQILITGAQLQAQLDAKANTEA